MSPTGPRIRFTSARNSAASGTWAGCRAPGQRSAIPVRPSTKRLGTRPRQRNRAEARLGRRVDKSAQLRRSGPLCRCSGSRSRGRKQPAAAERPQRLRQNRPPCRPMPTISRSAVSARAIRRSPISSSATARSNVGEHIDLEVLKQLGSRNDGKLLTSRYAGAVREDRLAKRSISTKSLVTSDSRVLPGVAFRVRHVTTFNAVTTIHRRRRPVAVPT